MAPETADTSRKGEYEHLIFVNVQEPLSAIAHHSDTEGITRSIPKGFPLHVAIHQIDEAVRTRNYIAPHRHEYDEMNLLLGAAGALEFDIQLATERYRLTSPASIWIPAGLEHAANVIRGSGLFVCVILAPSSKVYPRNEPTDAKPIE